MTPLHGPVQWHLSPARRERLRPNLISDARLAVQTEPRSKWRAFHPGLRIVRLLWEYWDSLLAGIWTTCVLSVIAMISSLVADRVACTGLIWRRCWIRLPERLLVEFGCNTPIIAHLISVHYALPDIIGITFTPFTRSLVALTFQTSGYLS